MAAPRRCLDLRIDGGILAADATAAARDDRIFDHASTRARCRLRPGARAPAWRPPDAGERARRAPVIGSSATVSRITAMICSGWVFSSRRTTWRAMAPASSDSWRCTCSSSSASGLAMKSRIDAETLHASSQLDLAPACCSSAQRRGSPGVAAVREALVPRLRVRCASRSVSAATRADAPGLRPAAGPRQRVAGGGFRHTLRRPCRRAAAGPRPTMRRAVTRISFCAASTSRQLDRALRLEVVLHHLRRALRHVLEELLLQLLVRRLERDDQLVARNLAQQLLHAAIVDARSGRRTRTSDPAASG